MIAATASVGWLLSMKTYRPVALILGFVLLSDPMFVPSYRGGRVDCWALAFCFGACWMVRYAMSQMQKGRPFRWALAMAGGMVTVAFFIWPSASLIYPLALAELIVLLREEYSGRKSGAGVLRSAMSFVVSGLVMTFLLLIPIWNLLKTIFNDIEPILSSSQPPYNFQLQVKNLVESLKYSQLLPVGALAGFICGRGRLIGWMALLAFVYILSTRLYFNRLIYLLPYAVGLIGSAYQVPSQLNANAKTRRLIIHAGLAVVIVGSISLSLIFRPAIALSQKGERDPSILFKMGRESIGDGPHKVYLGAWEFYFAGRWLGWQMFNEYVDQNDKGVSNLLSRSDHAIFHAGEVDSNLAAQLSQAGLRLRGELNDDRQHHAGVIHQLRLGAMPYGPYVLYSRQIEP
jgi:hypothetical protein